MLKTKKTPRDRAFFPTEFPRVSRVPEGISPEAFHLNREFLSVVMLRYMTSRLRAVYQAYEGDMEQARSIFEELLARQPYNLYALCGTHIGEERKQ